MSVFTHVVVGTNDLAKAKKFYFQAKMMTVCDIYDALTASDPPYKRALPPERALTILGAEAENGTLDAKLVRIFTEGKVWALTAGMRPGA